MHARRIMVSIASAAATLALVCLIAAGPAAGAPEPSREIVGNLDPTTDNAWEWAQGETVFLNLIARQGASRTSVRDLSGATCYGVLFDGTNNYLVTTGIVATAASGTVSFTISAAESNLATNDYTMAFFATGPTSTVFLGRAAVEIVYSPDASAPRVSAQDFLATSSIVTGAVYSGGGSVAQTGHVFTLDAYLGATNYATNTIVSGDGKTNTIVRRGRVVFDWTVTE